MLVGQSENLCHLIEDNRNGDNIKGDFKMKCDRVWNSELAENIVLYKQ
jgi:hypothetical protein